MSILTIGLHRRLLRLSLLLFIRFIIPVGLLKAQSLPQPELITAKQGLPQAFVPAIVQDQQGFIWMATRDGLARYDGNAFKIFQPNPDGKPALTSPGIASLTINPYGHLWICSEQGDLDLFDPVRETFSNVSRLPFYSRQLGHDRIDNYYPDHQNRLWLVLRRQGLVCIDLLTYQVHRFSIRPQQRLAVGGPDGGTIQQDRWGTIWVAAMDGLYQLDLQTDRFKAYPLPDRSIQDLYAQPNGTLLVRTSRFLLVVHPKKGLLGRYPLPAHPERWVSHFTTDQQGRTYFNLDSLLLRFHPEQGLHLLGQLPDSRYCRSLFVDRSDVLWMGTNGQGVRKYNLRAATFEARPYVLNFQSDLLQTYFGIPAARIPHFPAGSSAYNFRYTFDQQGKLWFNVGGSPFYQLDPATKQIKMIPFPAAFKRDDVDQSASLATDPDGRVWAIYDSLLVYYEKDHWKRFPFSIQEKVELPVSQLVVDRETIWLATLSNGLYRVDRATGQIRHYQPQSGNRFSLSSRELIGLFDDPLDSNLLWIGTFGRGLCRFDKRNGQCRRLTTQDGLPNNVVYAAIADRRGSIWVATNQGLCQLDRHTFQTRTYTQEDGLQADEFNRFHFIHLPGPVRRSDGTADDRIVLGGIGGITSFKPAQIREDRYQPPIQITAIQVNNQPLSVRDSVAVSAIQELKLAYNQNFVMVAFAAMQYNRQTKIRYRYWLEGLNQNWIYTDRPVAEYTALRPGHYRLRLNGSNTSGRWSPHIRTLSLVIQPPWWATNWAYGGYGLLLLGLGYWLARLYRNRLYLRQSIRFEQKEATHLREVDAMKTRFFTNITHEFRTPLTLILTPVEQMMEEDRSSADRHRLSVIDRNAHQLLGLINQLLDLAKLETGSLTITPGRGHLGEWLNGLISSFEPEAHKKHIQLTYDQQAEGEYWFDPAPLERIVYNLVANALKFTPAGGRVTVTLTPGVYLTVSDTGMGIPPDKLETIFDRFYQVDPATIEFSNKTLSPGQPAGTGIGLALVHELVTLLGGSVQVTSEVGVGSTFTVHLPFHPVTILDLVPPVLSEPADAVSSDTVVVTSDHPTDDVPTLLVVEDNPELLDFIASSMPGHYQIHRAINGEQGLAEAFQCIPDLIISDVMMPGMDGYTLCQRLKQDERTSHIPFILLTAKAALASRIQGLALGADDYLAKPFHLEELRLRVQNQLDRQRRLQAQLLKQLIQPVEANSPSEAPSLNPFLDQLYSILEARLDDSEFGVDQLAAQAHMSRMHLLRKLKALTGLPPSEFIRTYRLKRATQLLREGQPVSQTAYAVGFESPAHFSRCFRQLYGVVPSLYGHPA